MQVLAKLALIAALATAGDAAASYSCSSYFVSPVIVTYDPAFGANSTGSFTFTCSRTSTTDPALVKFSLDSNGGTHNNPPNTLPDRVGLGATSARMPYILSTDTGADWFEPSYSGGNTQARISGMLQFIGTSLTATASGSYGFRMSAGQVVPQVQAGTDYTDIVGSNLRLHSISGTSLLATPFNSSFTITVKVVENCVISSLPGAIQLAYTSFQPAISNATNSFDISCTKGTTYSLNLDAVSGTLMDLDYTLKLSAKSSKGTGVPQSFSISGSMVAGQSGTCAAANCMASEARTLLISY
ncbi:MAG: hypothetical protein ABI905_08855 [Betaproteobacteria bacterium]